MPPVHASRSAQPCRQLRAVQGYEPGSAKCSGVSEPFVVVPVRRARRPRRSEAGAAGLTRRVAGQPDPSTNPQPRAQRVRRLEFGGCVPTVATSGQDWMNASRSALMVSAWVVGMPCGKPAYVFRVALLRSCADSGAESA